VETLLAQANAASPTGSTGSSGAFRLTVEDVFSISGRGTVVTGRVESGQLATGQRVEVVRAGAVVATTYVTGIEKFRAKVETATLGENVGLLVGLPRDQVQQGDLLQGSG
jgi:translation elongation factor EF-Tu-like GTPase